MKLYEVSEKVDLELNFKFKDFDYCMNVNLQMKRDDIIYIQAINFNGEPVDNTKLNDATLTYKAKDGIYVFINLNVKMVTYQGVYMYAVYSDYDAKKINRRDAYRVFIGETYSVKAINKDETVFTYSGILKDISTTGLGIIMTHRIDNLSFLEIVLEITEKFRIPLIGEIINITELPKHRGYLYGCKLNGRSEILTRYVLKRQVQNKHISKAPRLY